MQTDSDANEPQSNQPTQETHEWDMIKGMFFRLTLNYSKSYRKLEEGIDCNFDLPLVMNTQINTGAMKLDEVPSDMNTDQHLTYEEFEQMFKDIAYNYWHNVIKQKFDPKPLYDQIMKQKAEEKHAKKKLKQRRKRL